MINRFEKELYLTFDVDWALDEVTDYVFGILEDFQVTGTFFMTHQTARAPIYERRVELGVHPNFAALLTGQKTDDQNAGDILRELKRLYPSAVSSRSHGLTQSGYLNGILLENGISFESNTLIPYDSNAVLFPYNQSGIVHVPFLFEDDVYLANMRPAADTDWNPDEILNRRGIKVVSFHPIHVYMNAYDLDRYAQIRPKYHDIDTIRSVKRSLSEGGVGRMLVELIREAKNRGFTFKRICEVNETNA